MTFGRDLLELRQAWRDDYDLTLSLFNGITQAQCLLADYNGVDETVKEIKDHARTSDDMLPSLMLQVYSMTAVMRLDEALDLGLEMLEQLGERIPRRVSRVQMVASMVNVNIYQREQGSRHCGMRRII